MTRETAILRRVLLEIGGRSDVRLSRNNAGVATYPDGSRVKYGVFNPGGADCIGLQRVVITLAMVGETIGRFIAIETKSDDGETTDQQDTFLHMVRTFGGVGVVVRSVAEAQAALDADLFGR